MPAAGTTLRYNGASADDGMAIVWAIVEFTPNHLCLRACTLFATHYQALTNLAARLAHVLNFSMAVAEWRRTGRIAPVACLWRSWRGCRGP